MTVFSLFTLLGGLAFFLFGMKVMSGSLEKMAGGKLEHMLKRMTSNVWLSLAIGGAITIAMQSSSATTVMLVSLVNSGIMKFAQTLGVIYGANIGTTLTSWILSLSGIESDNFWLAILKPENFSPVLAFIGSLMLMFSKKDRKKSIGTILVGFAVLMYGMELMKGAVSPLSEMPAFTDVLVRLKNPILGVLVGLVFTAVIQSSAASIAILQALALTGSITFGMAIPIVMGQNIGTCATSLISCIGTNAPAKRVATVHVTIKILGTAICLPLYLGADAIFRFAFADAPVSAAGIALIHTVFNILTVLILMPFTKLIVKLIERLIPEKPVKGKHDDVFPLDERLLRSPSVAIHECDNYCKKMCALAYETILASFRLLENYDEKIVETVLENEDKLDAFEDKLSTYLVKLSAQSLSDSDSRKITKCLHTLGDFERLGDHAVNLYKVALEIHEKEVTFSEAACRELAVLTSAAREILRLTSDSYIKDDVDIAGQVEPLEQVIDHLTSEIKSNHIARLQKGVCTVEFGFILSDMLTNFERISDHCSNIAVAVIEVEHNSFDTHKYLNEVKYGDPNFTQTYEEYLSKFAF